MKRTNIVILVFIAISIAVLISFMGDLSTYETIASARQKEGKSVTIIAKLDKGEAIQYDPRNNPNYLSFHVTDTLGNRAKVVTILKNPTIWKRLNVLCSRVKCTGMFLRSHRRMAS